MASAKDDEGFSGRADVRREALRIEETGEVLAGVEGSVRGIAREAVVRNILAVIELPGSCMRLQSC